MAVIAEPVAKPVSRFHFLLDRREVLEAILVAPAIIYVLLLVGLPLLLAVYYSVSAYTIYDPTWKFVGLANFRRHHTKSDLHPERWSIPSSLRSARNCSASCSASSAPSCCCGRSPAARSSGR